MTTTTIKATDIIPLHEVEDTGLFSSLVGSIYRKGWDGRPLLAARTSAGEICALTGSHRIAAAKHIDAECEVYFVAMTDKQIEDCQCGFQDDRIKIIMATGDADAIALFELELKEGR